MLCRAVLLNDFINLIFVFSNKIQEKRIKIKLSMKSFDSKSPISFDRKCQECDCFCRFHLSEPNISIYGNRFYWLKKILRCNFGATNKILRTKLITILKSWDTRKVDDDIRVSCSSASNLEIRKRKKENLWMTTCCDLFLYLSDVFVKVFKNIGLYLIIVSVWRGKYVLLMNCVEF